MNNFGECIDVNGKFIYYTKVAYAADIYDKIKNVIARIKETEGTNYNFEFAVAVFKAKIDNQSFQLKF